LSRVFGIFSEEIVRIWANDHRSAYQDVGRPTLFHNGARSTLDFTLLEKKSGRHFVVEQKCEIEYQNFRYFVLDNPRQLDHHKKQKPAFKAFLECAKPSSNVGVSVGGREFSVDGAILIWGAVTQAGRESVIEEFGFGAVLALADIISDLQMWNSTDYLSLIDARQLWSTELFDFLARQQAF